MKDDNKLAQELSIGFVNKKFNFSSDSTPKDDNKVYWRMKGSD